MSSASETYAVVQENLDQPLTRPALEQAIAGVPGLVRADAARIGEDLFGFVAENLSRESATVFARQLTASGFDCAPVAQRLLPKLMIPLTVQRLFTTPMGIECRTIMEQAFTHPFQDIVLAAAGLIYQEERKRTREFTTSEVNWKSVAASTLFHIPLPSTTERRTKETEIRPAHLYFRIELFATREPFRLNGGAGPQSVLFLDNQRLDPARRETLAAQVAKLHAGLQGVRVNRGIERIWDADFIYPSVRAFEEECRWRLHKAMTTAQ